MRIEKQTQRDKYEADIVCLEKRIQETLNSAEAELREKIAAMTVSHKAEVERLTEEAANTKQQITQVMKCQFHLWE